MILGKVGKENEKVNKRFVNCLGDVLEHYPLESERVLNPFLFSTLYTVYKIKVKTISNFQNILNSIMYIVYKIQITVNKIFAQFLVQCLPNIQTIKTLIKHLTRDMIDGITGLNKGGKPMERIKITLEDFEKVVEVGSCSKGASGSFLLLSEPIFLKAYDNLVYLKYRHKWETIQIKHTIDELAWLMSREDDIQTEKFLEELVGCFTERIKADILDRLMDSDLLAFYQDIFNRFYNIRKEVLEGVEVLLRHNEEDRKTLFNLGYEFSMLDNNFEDMYYLFKEIRDSLEIIE